MCGIFGVLAAGSAGALHRDYLFDALITGQVRGMHGTGVMTVTREGRVYSKGLAVHGSAFLEDKRARKVLNSIQGARVVVGHNRFTTSGDNVDEHCHPFKFKHVCGVHNGGVADRVLNLVDKDNSHEVDSGRIFAALNAADDPLEVLTLLHQGAYCLVWTDTRTKALYFARNGSRPMHVAETGSGMYFASELGMLTWLLARNKVTHASTIPIASLDQHVLYKIPLADPSGLVATPYDVKYPAVKPVPPARTPALPAPADDDDVPDFPSQKITPISRQHAYYQGTGIFGPQPAAVAYKRYMSANGLCADFQCMRPVVDVLHSLEGEFNSSPPEVPFALLGMGTDIMRKRCAYGLVSRADGSGQMMGMPVSCTLRNADEVDLVASLLTEGYDADPKKRRFPVVPLTRQALLLRPTGELIILGTFPHKYGTKQDLAEVGWCANVDQTVAPWVHHTIGPDCLINMTPDQLVSQWVSLRAGKTPLTFDDLPW